MYTNVDKALFELTEGSVQVLDLQLRRIRFDNSVYQLIFSLIKIVRTNFAGEIDASLGIKNL